MLLQEGKVLITYQGFLCLDWGADLRFIGYFIHLLLMPKLYFLLLQNNLP
jgi:hypothetical protein